MTYNFDRESLKFIIRDFIFKKKNYTVHFHLMNATPNGKKLNVQWFPTLCNHNVLELLDKLYSEEIKQVKREDIDFYRIYWKDSTINSSCVFSSEGLDYYIDDNGDVIYTKVKEEKEEKLTNEIIKTFKK